MIRALVKPLQVSEQSDTNMLYKHKVNPRARGTQKSVEEGQSMYTRIQEETQWMMSSGSYLW